MELYLLLYFLIKERRSYEKEEICKMVRAISHDTLSPAFLCSCSEEGEESIG
jgi:hypothetical protein